MLGQQEAECRHPFDDDRDNLEDAYDEEPAHVVIKLLTVDISLGLWPLLSCLELTCYIMARLVTAAVMTTSDKKEE